MGTETSEGWSASIALGFERRRGRTVLTHRRRQGPLSVQRSFYPEDGVAQVYLLHPPGGVVGGDRLELDLRVGEGAHALITTPGAAKFYRSAGASAEQRQRLYVCDDGILEWFPHENILFPGARLRGRTRVELARGARFMGWEIHGLGRPVIGERFDTGSADLAFDVLREGRSLLSERLRIESTDHLEGPSVLRGFPVSATFLATGAGPGDLEAGRQSLDGPRDSPCAMTLVQDLLVARCLANRIEPVQRIFAALWGILRPRLLAREACPPRIWAT